jgi:hypothetical protein
MPLEIVRGRISNVMATKELIPIIEKLNNKALRYHKIIP